VERGKRGSARVDVTRTLELLKEHITEALCGAAFKAVRTTERQRRWSLMALVQFWTAVILRAPPSLSHALCEMREGREPLAPAVQASDEAFFERCRDLSWKFFREVFCRLIEGLAGCAKPRFCAPLVGLRERFEDVLLIDGSRVAAIAHKLKILWDVRAVVLPGCLLGVYDLFRGIPRILEFTVDAAAGELTRAKEALARIKPDTLIVGDRLYAMGAFFQELKARGLWGLFRRNQRMGLRRLGKKPLRKTRWNKGRVEEWLVDAGSGASAPVQRLRLIRWKSGRTVRELLTNVLDSDRLTAEAAMALYPCRWQIERMFYDLKEVLNLNRVYAANPNAVGMQVYAAALVYVTLRVAQGEIAEQADIAPEEISPQKFFPKMAAACHAFTFAEYGVDEMMRLNPGKALKRPRWKGRRFTTISLDEILVNKRQGTRRRRKYCKARRQWKSITRVRGGRELS
jgi:hypothetical protein